MTLAEAIEKLPKTDLHCHLDGSIRPTTLLDLARREKLSPGFTSVPELKERLAVGKRVSSLETFLKAFDLTCAVLQTKENIERVSFELAEDAAQENVRYLEVRMAPILCQSRGLSNDDVIAAMRKGLARAERSYPIQTGIIVCALRNRPAKVSVEMAEVAVRNQKMGVVGFDLAHAEKHHPAKEHAAAFNVARKAKLGITCHAGEDAGPESIRQAIEVCGATRIGHGRTLVEDPALERLVAERGIGVEACPSSNVQIGLTASFEKHPLRGYLERGVCVSLNTDNRFLTDIRVTDEYLRAAARLKLSFDRLAQLARNGFRSAFLPEGERIQLLESAEKEIESLKASFAGPSNSTSST